jgi:peptidoglycan/LPS O-acetylase OafA/YrhL
MTIRNKRLTAIMLTVVLLLLIPFIAMQFTGEVKWSPSDFIVAAVLLAGTGILCELVLRKVRKISQRIALCATLLTALLLVWLELAVGIFGTPFAGQ